MEQSHRDWTLRAKAYPDDDQWGALVEVWEPGTRRTHSGMVLPFTRRFSSAEDAEASGIEAARTWVDQQLRRRGRNRRGHQ